MAQWIWQHLKPRLPGLSKIIIQEMQLSGCGIAGIESGSCFFDVATLGGNRPNPVVKT